MRRVNAVLTAAIMAVFLLHSVFGAFQLFGLSDTALKPLAWIGVVLIAAHTLIGIKLTIDTLLVWRKTGAPYLHENRLFWARRVSGLAVMALLLLHITAFSTTVDGVYRLKWFTGAKLAVQLLLVLALAVHIITNVKPALISFGIKRLRPWTSELLLVLSVILLLAVAAFIVYYLRWNVL